MPAKQGPLVRGVCPAGHVVETRAPHRRVTWRGACPHPNPAAADGKCGLHVVCNRVAEEPAPQALLDPEPPAAGGPRRIRKVAAYRDHGLDPARPDEPGFNEPPPPEPEPLGGREPGVSESAPAAGTGPPRPGADPDPGPGRRRGLLGATWDRLRAPVVDYDGDEDDWTVPGIYR